LDYVQLSQIKMKRIKALNYLMGQVMKATKGKANPHIVIKLLLERLNKIDEKMGVK